MIYFAHRGLSSRAVQNTLPSFLEARKCGAVCYELDVHVLKDGQLAVHHDYSLLATAGTDVELKDLTAADLQKYPLQNRFDDLPVQVPLLQEVLPIIEPELQLLNIEIKNEADRYPDIEKKILSFLEKYPHLWSKILFSSFDYNTLLRLRNIQPQARIGVLTRAFDINRVIDVKAESVHLNYTRITSEIISQCHAHYLKVYLYTVNDRFQAGILEKMGADGIFTDCADLFLPKK